MRQQAAFWLTCILLVLICNVLDAAVTVCAVEFGDATEANPLMAVLLHAGTVQFVVVKHLLVSLGLVLLWRLRVRPLARRAAMVAMTVYPLLFAYEVWAC